MTQTPVLRLAGILAVLAIIGSVARPNIIGLGEGHTAQLRMQNMELVYTALQIFAAEHGRYPYNVEEANRVFLHPGAKYLPDDLLMPSPYGGQQERLLSVVQPLGSAANPTPTGTGFESYENNLKPAGWNHLGAMLYDATPDGRSCVIYGIGHKRVREGYAPWFWNKLVFSGTRIYTRTINANEADSSWLKRRKELIDHFGGGLEINRSLVPSNIAKPIPGFTFLYF